MGAHVDAVEKDWFALRVSPLHDAIDTKHPLEPVIEMAPEYLKRITLEKLPAVFHGGEYLVVCVQVGT